MKLNTTTGQKPARGFELEANASVEMETNRGVFIFKGRGYGIWGLASEEQLELE